MNAYGDSVTVVNAPLIVGYGGSKVRDWAHATRSSVAASVQPDATIETTSRRDTSRSWWRGFAPYDAGVDAYSRIEWDGDTYELDGDPQRWKRFGVPDHVEFVMSLVREPSDV